MTTWTPVGERLPDSDLTVLIASNADEPVWLGYHDGEEWREVSGEAAAEVTHWAPIPEPPCT